MKIPQRPSLPARPGGRAGVSAAAVPFWVVALFVFVVPFLRPREGELWIGEDTRRAEVDVPFDEDVAAVEEELGLELAGPIAEASEAWFGVSSSRLREAGLVEVGRLESGRALFALHCQGCHGETGDGAGPAARFLHPRPRNFRKGVFKFTSTDTGEKPRREDLLRTITQGLAGASMPAFRLLPLEKRLDLVEYVRWLAIRGEFEGLALDEAYDSEELPDLEELAEIVIERWDPQEVRAIYPPEETERDAASVERGRELFLSTGSANCSACHGTGGKGDGPTADQYLDDWGYPIRPRDLTSGVFRSGQNPEDLWRSIATGINGTPMGAFRGALTGEQIWDLVHFVMSLSQGSGED